MQYKIVNLRVKNFKCFDDTQFYEFRIEYEKNPIILSISVDFCGRFVNRSYGIDFAVTGGIIITELFFNSSDEIFTIFLSLNHLK